MEKKKYYSIPKTKKDRIGYLTGLFDKDKNEIKTGDKVYMEHNNIFGVVLWNRFQKCYGICCGLWYKDKNPLDFDCYGKFISIPNDNGMRMEIKIV